jgi:hypothetical protein
LQKIRAKIQYINTSSLQEKGEQEYMQKKNENGQKGLRTGETDKHVPSPLLLVALLLLVVTHCHSQPPAIVSGLHRHCHPPIVVTHVGVWGSLWRSLMLVLVLVLVSLVAPPMLVVGVGSQLVLAIPQHHHTHTCTHPGSCYSGPSRHSHLVVVHHFALPVVPPLVVVLHVVVLVIRVPFLALLSLFLIVMFELSLSSLLPFCLLSLGSCSHHSVAPAIGFIFALAYSS